MLIEAAQIHKGVQFAIFKFEDENPGFSSSKVGKGIGISSYLEPPIRCCC
jgi:hypothetical protein